MKSTGLIEIDEWDLRSVMFCPNYNVLRQLHPEQDAKVDIREKFIECLKAMVPLLTKPIPPTDFDICRVLKDLDVRRERYYPSAYKKVKDVFFQALYNIVKFFNADGINTAIELAKIIEIGSTGSYSPGVTNFDVEAKITISQDLMIYRGGENVTLVNCYLYEDLSERERIFLHGVPCLFNQTLSTANIKLDSYEYFVPSGKIIKRERFTNPDVTTIGKEITQCTIDHLTSEAKKRKINRLCKWCSYKKLCDPDTVWGKNRKNL